MINLKKTPTMKTFELMAISAPMQETIETTRQILTDVINQYGQIEDICEWGEKRLAYRIGDYEKGYYFLYTFNGDSECVKELDRKARNSEEILRHMIISKSL